MDTDAFCRRLRLAKCFFDKENYDNLIVRNKNVFIPPKGRNYYLDKFGNADKSFPVEQHSRYNYGKQRCTNLRPIRFWIPRRKTIQNIREKNSLNNSVIIYKFHGDDI